MPSRTQRWGAIWEAVAEEALLRDGYVIVERNWRGAHGEIDRIAWERDVLCFIEVRARSTKVFGFPSSTIGRRKQVRVARAAHAYLTRFASRTRPLARFDVVSIVDHGRGHPEIVIIKNAFAAPS